METCKHRSAVMLGHRRTTRAPNRRRGWMYTLECLRCGVVPMGQSNDRVPDSELSLASDIADTCMLWEPGRERAQRLEWILDVHLTLYGVARRTSKRIPRR